MARSPPGRHITYSRVYSGRGRDPTTRRWLLTALIVLTPRQYNLFLPLLGSLRSLGCARARARTGPAFKGRHGRQVLSLRTVVRVAVPHTVINCEGHV